MEQALKDISAALDAQKAPETTPEAPVIDDNVIDGEVSETSEENTEETGSELESNQDSGDDIKTFSQLAKAIEVDAEYLYGIEVGMGDNQDAIPLGKLKDEYQNAIRERDELTAKIQEQQALVENAQAGVTQHQQVNQAMQAAQNEMMQVSTQYNNIDWALYEQESPGEAALARQKFNEAYAVAQQNMGMAQQQSEQERVHGLQNAGQKLMEVLPAWKDPAVRAEGQAKVKQALLQAGYTPDMIAGASDYRAIALMNELIGYREKYAQAETAMEKVKVAPKVLGGRSVPSASRSSQTNEMVKKAKKTNNKHDQLSAVKSIMGIK